MVRYASGLGVRRETVPGYCRAPIGLHGRMAAGHGLFDGRGRRRHMMAAGHVLLDGRGHRRHWMAAGHGLFDGRGRRRLQYR